MRTEDILWNELVDSSKHSIGHLWDDEEDRAIVWADQRIKELEEENNRLTRMLELVLIVV